MENQYQQHLDLIAQVIKSAQRRYQDDSPYYILWGCAVFLACIAQFILLHFAPTYNGLAWGVSIPAAIIIQMFIIQKQKKKEKMKTHIESLMVSMWIAFGVTLFIILSFSFKLENNTYPIVLCLYAFSTFVSGSAFKIKAFLFGSIACWVLAIISFFVVFEIQLLLLATGVLFAFIIPGIVLRKNNLE
jgi:hypothetical protein